MTAAAPSRSWSAVVTGFAFWLCLAGVTALALVRERDQALEHARQSAVAIVALLEQHTVATFRSVDVALEDTATRLATTGAPRHDPDVRQAMQLHLRDMPYVRALYVIGPDGFIQHDTDYPKTPDVSLADRDYFKAYVNNPKLVATMSDPLLSRAGLGWFVPVTRRLAGEGDFRGIAVAAIQLRYFGELYNRMGLTQGQRIALFHRDGRLLAQYPPDDTAIGKTYAEYPLFKTHVSQSGAGTYITSGPPTPAERILSYRVVDKQPLVVLMAHETAAVLAPWWRAVYGAAAALGVLLVVMAGAIALRLHAEAERQRAEQRMARGEKLEALGRLTGSIAHDFNNVLGIIGNSLSLINALPQGKDEQVRSAVSVGRKAVATGARLTHDLLSFARQRELRLAPADLSEAVAQMRPILEQAAGPRTGIETMLSTGLRRVELDYTQLQVTLINLVVNARDAMGGAGTVGISTANADRVEPGWWRVLLLRKRTTPWVSLTVSDNGAGMSEEVVKRALEPFFTTKGEQGTGLGLAQVYGFMNQLNGDVRIDSTPGQGTQVHLYFRALESR